MGDTINRPSITPAQIAASLCAGIPILANLAAAFGVFVVNAAQQDALQQSVTWGGVFAGLFVLGDAGLRSARNHAEAKVQAATIAGPSTPNVAVATDGGTVNTAAESAHPMQTTPFGEDGQEIVADAELPSDDEEFRSPPPDETNTPVQPSQDG